MKTTPLPPFAFPKPHAGRPSGRRVGLKADLQWVLLSVFPVVLFALLAATARAETYYVDATQGRDTYNGKSTVVSGTTVGPWQTLAKISATAFLPGDKVLLKCGEVWRESLRINASGVPGQPITLGSYPESCDNKPVIDGSTPLPAQSWSYLSNGIYRALLGGSLAFSNTFTGSLNGWTKWSPNQDGMLFLTSSCDELNDTCLRFLSGRGTGYNLLLGPNLSLQAGAAYQLSFALKAPNGLIIRPALRRASQPNETVGLHEAVTGTGNWQTYRITFTATATLSNARIEFEVPTAYKDISLDDVRLDSLVAMSNIAGVFSEGRSVNIAHHPNRGHNPQSPTSLYLTIAENADRVTDSTGRTVSTYLSSGPDLKLPAGASLGANTGIRIRVNSWMIDDRKIAAQSGARLHLDKPTSYPVEKDWGYYLYGQRWMLDEPGEWFYDAAAGELLVRMPDDQPPGSRVSVAQRDVGIDASGRSHVVIDGIALRNFTTGVNMRNSVNVALRNASISDTLGDGVDALQSTEGSVERSLLVRTGGDAIWAAHGPDSSSRFAVRQNSIKESGVLYAQGALVNLPIKIDAAITVGDDATVVGNTVDGSAYIGVRTYSRGWIANNLIENTCLVLDDCGAIYVNGQNNASVIRHNIIRNVLGSPDGKSTGYPTQGQGIMLDDLSSLVAVSGNTIINADNGIQLHNAAINIIEYNKFYGNRKSQLWFQEQTNKIRSNGDLYDNFIIGNQYFPLSSATNTGLLIQSSVKTTAAFAAFDDNVYSTLLNPNIAWESWPGGETAHTFAAWQTAQTSNGVPRYLDPNGHEVKQSGYAAYRTAGGNIVENGNLRNGTSGWSAWNQTAPYGSMQWEVCAIGYCLNYSAGASASLLVSPNFSVVKDNVYRVSFDFKTGANNQLVSALVRRGGGGQNNYEGLAGSDEKVIGSTAWKRHSYTFKALKTVNKRDPITLDNGARVDFQNLMPGQSISVANLEIVPITTIETSLRTHILTNPSDSLQYMDCPDSQSNPAVCDEYVHFADGNAAIWPIAIAPWDSEIIYSRDETLIDNDLDGIANTQDTCPNTATGQIVNAAGCALSQSYP